MSGQPRKLVANLSLLFAELPLLERPAAAAAAGFAAVEAWWPFTTAEPADEITAFLAKVDAAGVALTGLNLFAGDMPAGERGLISRPDRQTDLDANLAAMTRIAEASELRGSNALYGQRQPGMEPAEQDRVGFANLVRATRVLGSLGVTVLVEPLSRGLNGSYPIETADQAVDLVHRVREAADSEAIALLFDTFHLANNDEDLVDVIRRHAVDIGHVQLADSPGRGAPGSGSVDFTRVLDALDDVGYSGLVACEYATGGRTLEHLDWIGRFPALSR